jgi:hypothetical protein
LFPRRAALALGLHAWWLRRIDHMRFRDLAIGDRFEFDHSSLSTCSGMAHGPWIKTNARGYRRETGNGTFRVGTTLVEVLKDATHCSNYVTSTSTSQEN